MADETAGDSAKQGDGNSKTSPKARAWLLTWFNYPENHKSIFETVAKSNQGKYIYQIEICPTTGRKHIQGGVYFKSVRTAKILRKCFPGCHHEVARNWSAVVDYCRKDETSTFERYTNIVFPRVIQDPLAGKALYTWQRSVVELVECWQVEGDRRIHWYYSDAGAIGKTVLARHLRFIFPNEIVYVNGKCADIKYAIAAHLEAGYELRACILALGRADNHIDYKVLEEVSDQIMFSPKYKSATLEFPPCHVVVFANCAPEEFRLSKDRWVIKKLDDPNSD